MKIQVIPYNIFVIPFLIGVALLLVICLYKYIRWIGKFNKQQRDTIKKNWKQALAAGIINILKAYHKCGFEGYIRPDHGRHLWGEKAGTVRPGYGLYDRALGIMYMLGVWDMLDKQKAEK